MTRLIIDSLTGEIFLQEELNSGYYEAEVIAKITVNDDEDLQNTSLVNKFFFFLKFLNKIELNCRLNSQYRQSLHVLMEI